MKFEKALDFVNQEIRSIELAPKINGCEMTQEWRDMLQVFETIREVLVEKITTHKETEGEG